MSEEKIIECINCELETGQCGYCNGDTDKCVERYQAEMALYEEERQKND